MTTMKGTIIRWLDRGFGFIQPEGTSGRDEQVFAHESNVQLPKDQLREGTAVEFEVQSTPKGLQAQNVRLPGQQAARQEPVEEKPVRGYRFLNPYNFVRYLPDRPAAAGDDPAQQLLSRSAPPPHDRWLGYSGHIECSLETITPLFVSGSEGVSIDREIKKHLHYRFFRLNGEKVIPATTLRGVTRSVFEAATNSCFATLGGERLSFRLPSNEVQKLVPARVEKNGDGWRLRLLPGQAPFAPEFGQKKGLYAAPVRFYKALRSTSRRRQDPPPPIDDPDKWAHGRQYFAVLRQMKFPPSWRVLALAGSEAEAQGVKARLTAQQQGQLVIQQGWLCKTNQNSDNKNSERFFFRDGSRRDVPETIPLPKATRDKYEALIEDYQRRHESDVKKRRLPARLEGDDIAFSRFVLNRKERRLRGGELVYVRLQGREPDLRIMFMAPVSWPRVAYEHSIADLLPEHLHRCTSLEELCPACRTFGWVHGQGKEVRHNAYAGRVRFSHAKRQRKGEEVGPQTLAILGAPKPTTTRFYLAGPNGKPSTRPRDDISVGYDGNRGRNRLRGRKFYRHYTPDPKYMNDKEKSDQNRTIHDPEGKGAVFTFTVSFENLAPVELGALLWSLTLGGKAYHKIGYGKPLGLGSVEMKVGAVVLYDFSARYGSLAGDGWQRRLTDDELATLVAGFQEDLIRPYASEKIADYGEKHGWEPVFEQLPNVQDIFALLGKEEPELPVHYPHSHDLENSKGQFEWFVGNNRLNGPRIEMGMAVEDKGLPLIDRSGKAY